MQSAGKLGISLEIVYPLVSSSVYLSSQRLAGTRNCLVAAFEASSFGSSNTDVRSTEKQFAAMDANPGAQATIGRDGTGSMPEHRTGRISVEMPPSPRVEVTARL